MDHIRHIGHVPIIERLVEGSCAFKHTVHINHFGHVPLIERLVEGPCACKHTIHIPHIGNVPFIERLVEGYCAFKFKHIFHIRYIGHVPIANLAVFCHNALLPSSADYIISYRPANTLIIQRRSNKIFNSSI